ncbi:MAG: FAD-dependent oxidoreductase [Planctomycetota bacterium]
MTETPVATSEDSAGAQPGEARSVTILGGGLAGLSAAQKFSEQGWDVTVIEKEHEVGGLASSFVEEGYTCDYGPHRLYSSLKELNDHFRMVLDGNHDDRARLSRIYMKGKFFDYPLKAGNVLRSLPPWLLIRSFLDYVAVRMRNAVRPIKDDNFENWVIKRFGRTLYDLFFGTYTRKAWGIPCTQISADWASQRISLLSLWDTVKKTLFKPRNTPRTYVSTFLYPVKGGIGELCRGYQRLVEGDGSKVITSADVVAIETEGDTVTGVTYEKDGARHTATSDLYISTLPLTVLVPMLGDQVPERCHEAVAGLTHKGIVFAYLKLDRPQLTPDHWIYIPEEHIAVHRISEFTNFSKDCAPEGKTLVCAEITSTVGDKYWTMDDDDLIKLATDNLVELGLLKADEVMPGGFVRRVDYAYPIYDLTYRGHVDALMGFLRGYQNMVSTGRQGLFRYGNMDHSVAMGHAVARRTLDARGIDHSEVAAGDEYFG